MRAVKWKKERVGTAVDWNTYGCNAIAGRVQVNRSISKYGVLLAFRTLKPAATSQFSTLERRGGFGLQRISNIFHNVRV